MSARDHFTDRGTHYDLSAAGAFLMVAIYAYDPAEPPAPKLRAHVNMILARATAAGFGQADVFCTILAGGERSERTMQLACDVVADVGGDAVMIAMINDFKAGKAGAA